jgi:hypothetical protein
MASLTFGTPQTATLKQYVISGTLAVNAPTIYQAVQMLVTRADNSTQGYYVSLPPHYNNSTVDVSATDTVLMPIIPQLTGTDSATAYLGQDLNGWIIQE